MKSPSIAHIFALAVLWSDNSLFSRKEMVYSEVRPAIYSQSEQHLYPARQVLHISYPIGAVICLLHYSFITWIWYFFHVWILATQIWFGRSSDTAL